MKRLAVGLALLCAGCDDLVLGASNATETTTPVEASSVLGFGRVLGRVKPDGTSTAQAALYLFDPANPAATLLTADAALYQGDTRFPLFQTTRANLFATSTDGEEAFTFVPGTLYTFSVDVNVSGSVTTFTATVEAPSPHRSVEPVNGAGLVASLSELHLELSSSANGASAAVSERAAWDTNVVYDSLTFGATGKTGADAMVAAHNAASAWDTGGVDLPAAAFPATGDYWVEVFNLGIVAPGEEGVSEGWDSRSWFVAGAATGFGVSAQ